jgi:hypothetical protein
VIIGVRRWALVVGVLAVLGASSGGLLGVRSRMPVPPRPCVDEMRLQCEQGTVSCDSRQRIEVYPHFNCLLIKCLCRRAP